MKCDLCKAQDATVFLTTVEAGKLRKLGLCPACAVAKGVGQGVPAAATISELIAAAGLVGTAEPLGERTAAHLPACPECGLGYGEFQKSGRLGCIRCYDAFQDRLEELLKGMHRGVRHVGKVPRAFQDHVARERALERLRVELRAAVKAEEYERAAALRDRIRAAEEEGRPESGPPRPSE